MYSVDTSCDTARDFLEIFLDSNLFEPKSIFDVSEKFPSGYLFRGHAKKEWRLIPSAHRTEEALKDYTPQPPFKREGRNVYLASHIHAELRAVQLFLEAADQIGIGTPIEYLTIQTTPINQCARSLFWRRYDTLLKNGSNSRVGA